MSKKGELYQSVIKACEDEYRDKIEIFTRLDSKAQQITAFSGILLGFIISFCKEDTLTYLSSISMYAIFFSIMSIVALMTAILFALLSMKVTKIIGMPDFCSFQTEFEVLSDYKDKEISNENYLNFLYSRIQQWKDTFDSIEEVNNRKAKLVNISQVACGCGLILIGFFAIIILNSSLK